MSWAGVAEADLDTRKAFRLARRRAALLRSTAGKREEPVLGQRRGKYCRPRFPADHPEDVALDATLRAAAARTVARRYGAFEIRPEDLREKVRRHRSPFVVAFVVDNSWSIHVETTLERTKGVLLELLKDARTHRDRVALVAFRHSRQPEATVCLPLTTSYALAAERLRKLPLSGSTPLPDAIRRAYHLLRQERIKYHNALPVMVVVTDGLPNVPVRPGGNPYEEVELLCRHLGQEGIATIVVDTEPGGSDAAANICRRMVALSRGKYLPLSGLTRRSIENALSETGVAAPPWVRKPDAIHSDEGRP